MAEQQSQQSENKAILRDARGYFLPGQAPVSPGRPAIAKEFKEKCKEFMQRNGWKLLQELAETHSKDQRYALELIAAYAYGKPTQVLAADASDDFAPLRIIIDSTNTVVPNKAD